MSVIIGAFIGAGALFIYAAIKETDKREKQRRTEKWRRRRP